MRIAVHDFVGHPFIFELTRQLAAEGHVARHFYFEGYPGPKGDSEIQPDDSPLFSVEPIRISQTYSTSKFISRGLNNILYGKLCSSRIAAFQPDIVLSANTPTEAQISIQMTTKRIGGKFIFWMQDFYSLAVKMLLSKRLPIVGGLIGSIYEGLERRQLANSDAIVLISDGFQSAISRLPVDQHKVSVIPNWGALSEIPLRDRKNKWRERHNLGEKIVFLYSGTLGMKHNPMMLVALADAFANDPDVVVVVASAGAGTDRLKATLEDSPRSNMMLVPLQPIQDFPDMLGASDVLVALLEADAGQFSVPSKILSYLCAGRSVLLAAPHQNLAAQTLITSNAGIAVEAGDVEAFVAAAKSLRDDEDLRRLYAASGRTYAESNFPIATVARRFLDIFNQAQKDSSATT